MVCNIIRKLSKVKIDSMFLPWDSSHVRSHRIARKFPLHTSAFQKKVGGGQLKLLDLSMDHSELFSPPADLLNLPHHGLLLFFSNEQWGQLFCLYLQACVGLLSHTYIIMAIFSSLKTIGLFSQDTTPQSMELHSLVVQQAMGRVKSLPHFRDVQLSRML